MVCRSCGADDGAQLGDHWRCNGCGAYTAVTAEPRVTHVVAPQAGRAGVPWWASLPLLGIVLFVGSGFFHCVHGGQVGCTVIRKDEWAVKDTFVDMDEVGRRSILEMIGEGRAPLLRALIREGIVQLPPAFRDP